MPPLVCVPFLRWSRLLSRALPRGRGLRHSHKPTPSGAGEAGAQNRVLFTRVCMEAHSSSLRAPRKLPEKRAATASLPLTKLTPARRAAPSAATAERIIVWCVWKRDETRGAHHAFFFWKSCCSFFFLFLPGGQTCEVQQVLIHAFFF
jgi:hypothetical protein